MVTATEILTLTQWLSPAYPVGAFAYSHGLEAAIADGTVTDAGRLTDWATGVLEHGAGRADATFLAAAHHADAADIPGIDATARAFAASAERLRETELMGAAFCEITAALWPGDLDGLTYPVALGRATRLAALPPILAAQMALQAFVGNLAAVGMRLIPLGQTDGQRILRDLAPACARIATETAGGDLATLRSTAFLSDIASMRHETLSPRIFRT
ncbi:urease accessory protein UreF [Jannaschia sp. KMU-145]|uniref:urease accessory protein UreF n=1 Tax=Jannaschia halovivens TaxID=3388667 RepID=UPI00396B21E7